MKARYSAIRCWSAIRSGILADHVTLEQGTGAVHTAPGHGQEDYAIGQKYGIATFCPVDAAGRFFRAEGAPGYLPDELIGKTVWEGNPIVMELLQETGALLGMEKLAHSYPHCWRCHNPMIFRATEQWFIGMELNDLRRNALEAIKKVKWMPEWGQERISNMIAVRPDWCISRQRVWGVPIIVFYCEGCREPVTDRAILDGIVALFAEHTADIWYERTAAELLPAGHKCTKCGGTEFAKETDILDVWFDSGSSHLAVLNDSFGLPWPADVYLEGGDQYRGWFHSSLLVGTGLRGGAPYRECLLNGWVLDGEGKAMHKSLGNSIEPESVIKDHGADILRLWTASVEFNEDVRMSPTILTRLVDAYRKLRNTFRYMLGNLSDFDAARDSVAAGEMTELDQWILLRAEDLVARCRAWYEGFEFHKIYHAVYAFFTVDLSAVYFEIVRDRLYTSAPKWKARRSAQTTLYRLLDAFVRLLAPLMSFTAEEVWGHMGRTESVHMAYFPEPAELGARAGRCRSETRGQLGPSHGSKGRRSEAPGYRAQRETDWRSAGSAGAAGGERGIALAAGAVRGRTAGALRCVAGGSGRSGGERTGRQSGKGGRSQVRALLEVHAGCGQRREFPDDLRGVRPRRARDH